MPKKPKRRLSDGHKAKISLALRGRKRPPEVRAKISASKLGKPKSAKTRAKMSESARIAQRVIRLFKPEIYTAQQERERARMRAYRDDPVFQERRAAGQNARWKRYWATKRGEVPRETRWQQIEMLLTDGMRQCDIARHLGVAPQRVNQEIKRHQVSV